MSAIPNNPVLAQLLFRVIPVLEDFSTPRTVAALIVVDDTALSFWEIRFAKFFLRVSPHRNRYSAPNYPDGRLDPPRICVELFSLLPPDGFAANWMISVDNFDERIRDLRRHLFNRYGSSILGHVE